MCWSGDFVAKMQRLVIYNKLVEKCWIFASKSATINSSSRIKRSKHITLFETQGAFVFKVIVTPILPPRTKVEEAYFFVPFVYLI